MDSIHNLVTKLRNHPDVGVEDRSQSWLIALLKIDARVEVTIPHAVLEWHARAVNPEGNELWSDWMDYEGYDKKPKDKLEEEMACDILSFIERVSIRPLAFPLSIHEKAGPAD